MKRIINSATVFATILSLGLTASAAHAGGSQNGNSRITSRLQKGPGVGSTTTNSNPPQGTNPSQPSTPSPTKPIWSRFPGNTKALGGIFNQTNQTNVPPVWKKFPPNGGKVLGGLFGQTGNSNPTQPSPTPKPTKPGHGNGYGFGFGVYGGPSFGGTVVTTDVTTVAPAASPVPPAPTSANAADSEVAPEMEVAAGSSFTIKGEKFGAKQGQIGLVVGGVLIPVQVTAWSETAIAVNVPMLGVDANAKATFVVKRADGSVAQGMACELVAAR